MSDTVAIGKLQAEVQHLQEDVSTLKEDVKELLALANKGKGGFWAGMTVASAFGGLVVWVIDHLPLIKG